MSLIGCLGVVVDGVGGVCVGGREDGGVGGKVVYMCVRGACGRGGGLGLVWG